MSPLDWLVYSWCWLIASQPQPRRAGPRFRIAEGFVGKPKMGEGWWMKTFCEAGFIQWMFLCIRFCIIIQSPEKLWCLFTICFLFLWCWIESQLGCWFGCGFWWWCWLVGYRGGYAWTPWAWYFSKGLYILIISYFSSYACSVYSVWFATTPSIIHISQLQAHFLLKTP